MTAPDVRTPGVSRANADQVKTNTTIIGHDADERKAQSTVAALLAMKGYELHELASGGFLVSRGDLTAHCSDLGAVRRAFYDRLDGAA